jgi:hypothetical protein
MAGIRDTRFSLSDIERVTSLSFTIVSSRLARLKDFIKTRLNVVARGQPVRVPVTNRPHGERTQRPMTSTTIRRPNYRRPALFAAVAMLTMVATAVGFAWTLLDPDGNVQSMKLNHAIMDEASAAPPATTALE